MTNFRKLQNEELNRISTEAFKKAPKLPVVILLDHVRSQNNVGSVFRTFSLSPGQKYALIFGNEVKGVQQEVIDLSDGCIEIPQFGTKHSFNISVTVGIVLWQIIAPLLGTLKTD